MCIYSSRLWPGRLGLRVESEDYIDNAPVAQLDRVSDYESEGWGFDSLQACHNRSVMLHPVSSRGYDNYYSYSVGVAPF